MSTSEAGRPGKTLVEVMVCLPLVAVLVAASSSSIYVASRAQVLDEGLLRERFEGGLAAARIAGDLRLATSCSRREARGAEFTVPDRDGDGIEERIRYEWSGVPGEPLLSQFNDGPSEVIAGGVRHFGLEYFLQAAARVPLDPQWTLLQYHDDAAGGRFQEWSLEPAKWCAQYVKPAFPPLTAKWKIKRFRFAAESDGEKTGILEVRITGADATGRPTGEIIDRVTLRESQLDDGMAWVDVDFSAANNLDPAAGVCLAVVQLSASGSAGRVSWESGGSSMPGDTHWMTTSDAGSSWTDPENDKDMRFFLYGTYEGHAGTPRNYLAGVGIEIQLGEDPHSRVVTSVNVLNAPEVVNP